MIAPIVWKTGVIVGAIGELAVIALAQTRTVDTTVAIGAALTFAGLLVASLTSIFMQRAAARNAQNAELARAKREDERDARALLEAERARILLETSAVKVEQIHTLVNSKDDKQNQRIEQLTEEIKELNRKLLARADAAPGPITHPPS